MVEPKSTQHQFQRKQKGESYQRNSAWWTCSLHSEGQPGAWYHDKVNKQTATTVLQIYIKFQNSREDEKGGKQGYMWKD